MFSIYDKRNFEAFFPQYCVHRSLRFHSLKKWELIGNQIMCFFPLSNLNTKSKFKNHLNNRNSIDIFLLFFFSSFQKATFHIQELYLWETIWRKSEEIKKTLNVWNDIITRITLLPVVFNIDINFGGDAQFFYVLRENTSFSFSGHNLKIWFSIFLWMGNETII